MGRDQEVKQIDLTQTCRNGEISEETARTQRKKQGQGQRGRELGCLACHPIIRNSTHECRNEDKGSEVEAEWRCPG
jgi:hypothetical protein